MTKANIFIAGAGGIGQAAALILSEYKDVMESTIYLGDINESALEYSKQFVTDGCSHTANIHTVLMPMSDSNDAINEALS